MKNFLEKAQPDVPTVSVSCLCGHPPAELVIGRGQDYEYATTQQRWTFVRCSACQHVYLSPRPHEDSLSVIYPSDYYAFQESAGTSLITRFFRSLFEGKKAATYLSLIPAGPRRLLDVGCGDGRFMAELRARAPRDFQIMGIDFDDHALARARTAGFAVVAARVEEYVPDALFDCIFFFQVIEHVADPRAVMKKMFSLLAPNGIVVIETPDLAGWDFALFGKGLWGGYHFPRHWHVFSPPLLRRLVEEIGFEVIVSRHAPSPAFWIHSLHHLALVIGAPRWIVNWFHVYNPLLLACVVPIDLLCIFLHIPTSNQVMVIRKPAGTP